MHIISRRPILVKKVMQHAQRQLRLHIAVQVVNQKTSFSAGRDPVHVYTYT